VKPKEIVLRCYGKKQDNQYVAVCIDLCLAAQGNSMEDARKKLFDQIHDYLYDAIEGKDSDHADYLLSRKAPISQLITYHALKLMSHIHTFKNGAYSLFSEVMPMKIKHG